MLIVDSGISSGFEAFGKKPMPFWKLKSLKTKLHLPIAY